MHQLSAQLTLLHEEKSGLGAPYISPAGRVNCVLKNGPGCTTATSTTVCSHRFEIPPGLETSNFLTPFVCNSIRVSFKVYPCSTLGMLFPKNCPLEHSYSNFLKWTGGLHVGSSQHKKNTIRSSGVCVSVKPISVKSVMLREKGQVTQAASGIAS